MIDINPTTDHRTTAEIIQQYEIGNDISSIKERAIQLARDLEEKGVLDLRWREDQSIEEHINSLQYDGPITLLSKLHAINEDVHQRMDMYDGQIFPF